MRAVILILAVAVLGCQGISKYVSNEWAIQGSWKLVGMTEKPVELDKIPQDGKIGGSMNFKSDKTYESELTLPGILDKGIKTDGTYRIEGDVLIMTSKQSNTESKSKIRFEKDYLIVSSTEQDKTATMYYKRDK